MKKTLTCSTAMAPLAAIVLLMLAAGNAGAATTVFTAASGINWSTPANFIDATSKATESPANNAANFTWLTASPTPGVVTVNVDGGANSYDGDYGQSGSGYGAAWGIIFGQTNGYHTVMVQPGVVFQMVASAGTEGGGGFCVSPNNTNSGGGTGGNTVSTGPYTNYTAIWGTNATFYVDGTLEIEAGASTPENHYTILDLSGVDTFIQTNTSPTGTGRLYVAGAGTQRSQAILYLAKTNFITPNSSVQIGYLGGTYSNSLPIGVYLGISNYIAPSNTVTFALGYVGCSNAFMQFNPEFLGGPTPPSVYLAGRGGTLMNQVYIGYPDNGKVGGTTICDFTGGNVTWLANNFQMGGANAVGVNALGILNFDNGTITANSFTVGFQQMSFASSGGFGSAIINIETNSTYNTSATLVANNSLTLASVTGTANPGTIGTINISGGTLMTPSIVTGGGTGIINTTNGTFVFPLNSTTTTNAIITTLNVGGATNYINISSITPELPASGYPVRFHVMAATINGTPNFGLGSLPPSFASQPYAGYVDTSNPGLVDVVLTSGPAPVFILTWTGTNTGGVSDGNWDTNMTDLDWAASGVPTFFSQYDLVNFTDSALGSTQVVMNGTLAPYAMTVTNSQLAYTLGGSGQLSGDVTLVKTGTNVLTLDESNPGGYNNFTGGVVISNGIVTVGNQDGNGTLGAGPVSMPNAAGLLIFNQGALSSITNVIGGSGRVVQAGGNTIQLAAANTFTNNVIVTNNSTLQGGNAGSFGSGSAGTVIVANGSTLDAFGAGITKSVSVSGFGVNDNGALTSSGSIYDSSGGICPNVILTGNTAFYYSGGNRWDLGKPATLSTGGQPYNLTLNANTYFEWDDVTTDPKLANVYLASGTFGFKGTTTLGNPTNWLVISNGANLTFYNDSSNPTLNKQVLLNDGGEIQTGSSATISESMIISNFDGSPNCIFNLGGSTTLTLASNVSGDGVLLMQSGSGTLNLAGNGSGLTGGVGINAGTFDLTGSVGCGVTNQEFTTLEGSGAMAGTVDTFGTFIPGTATAAGTFTVGNLILDSTSTPTFNLGSVTTTGQGVNSFVQVNGALTFNTGTIYINPLSALPNNSTYTLMACSSFSGSLPTVQTVQSSPYTLTLSTVTTSSNVLIQVTSTGGQPTLMLWNNASGDSQWDVGLSQNWSNETTHVAADYFYSFDSVVLDDTIASSPNPSATIAIPSGQAVIPTVMTNNSSASNYVINGAGKISGIASIVKLGSSTLTLATANDFSGNVTVGGGTILADTTSALGGPAGSIFVTNGGTLDLGYVLGSKLLVLSGAGVGGAGALVNSVGSPIYDNYNGVGGLTNILLAGNATIGGSQRVDFGQFTPYTGAVSSGGKNYSLNVVGTTYREWENVIFDTNFGNINVMTSTVGIKGATTLGNPTNMLAVFSNAAVDLYEDNTLTPNANVNLNKTIMLYGGSTFDSAGGSNFLFGPVILGTNSADVCNLAVGGTSLAITNTIGGPGTLDMTGSSPLYLLGANNFTGNTVIAGGTMWLVGNGSISTTPNINLAGGAINVSLRNDQMLTLASGQTLQGTGTLSGSLTVNAGATLAPASSNTIGTISVTNLVSLFGTTVMAINSSASQTSDRINAVTNFYGGQLVLTNLGPALVAGNTFQLFNASSNAYVGSFSSITPASPGAGLAWNTSQLNTSGTISVVSASSPVFGSVSFAGGNIYLTGSNGAPGQTFYILSSTNLASGWTVLSTNAFDGNGDFNLTNTVGTNLPQQFFGLYDGQTPP